MRAHLAACRKIVFRDLRQRACSRSTPESRRRERANSTARQVGAASEPPSSSPSSPSAPSNLVLSGLSRVQPNPGAASPGRLLRADDALGSWRVLSLHSCEHSADRLASPSPRLGHRVVVVGPSSEFHTCADVHIRVHAVDLIDLVLPSCRDEIGTQTSKIGSKIIRDDPRAITRRPVLRDFPRWSSCTEPESSSTVSKEPLVAEPSKSTTALGAWYATVLFWKPNVALFVNEATLRRPAPSTMHAAQSRTATFIRRCLLRRRRPSTSGAPRSSLRTTRSQRTPEARSPAPRRGSGW